LINFFSVDSTDLNSIDLTPESNGNMQSKTNPNINTLSILKNNLDVSLNDENTAETSEPTSENESEHSSELGVEGFLMALLITGVIMELYGIYAKASEGNKYAEIPIFLLNIFVLAQTFAIIAKIIKDSPEPISDFTIGFAWGLIVAHFMIIVCAAFGPGSNFFEKIDKITKYVAIAHIIINFGILYDVELFKNPAVILDLTAIIFASATISSLKDRETRDRAFGTFAILALYMSFVFFLIYAFTYQNS